MTKERRPLTPYRALSRIADLLGWDGCAEVIGKSEWSVRKFSDPDTGREISFIDAVRLDDAYGRAGGEDRPFHECFGARLGLLTAANHDAAAQLLETSGKAAKESGEAIAAALMVAADMRDAGAVTRAIIETEEGIQALFAQLARLKLMGGQV
ncbi:hypothetical protein [Novosphingobium sp. 9]|uniref:hypothetical protein n=1 Tax=Novosphingobium sp. 9 TaxID=2025349 RepID=UPI0021B59307|nr:hypothetical protein [Novosphingobium sp. 9]